MPNHQPASTSQRHNFLFISSLLKRIDAQEKEITAAALTPITRKLLFHLLNFCLSLYTQIAHQRIETVVFFVGDESGSILKLRRNVKSKAFKRGDDAPNFAGIEA